MAAEQSTQLHPEIKYDCHNCGNGFSGRKRRYCSTRCREASYYKSKKEDKSCWRCGVSVKTASKKVACPRCVSEMSSERGRLRGNQQDCTCKQCRKMFRPKAANRVIFCSRECSFAHGAERKKRREEQRVGQRIGKCLVCEKEFDTRNVAKYCSSQCKIEMRRRKDRDIHTRTYEPKPLIYKRECVICRRTFRTNKPKRRTCSIGCKIENAKQKRFDLQRRRKAKLSAATIVLYSRLEIFTRDNWTCYLCGKVVVIKGPKWHPRKATIDHVIPISKGGDEAPWNVKCCCFKCNTDKGDMALDDYQAQFIATHGDR